MRQQQYQVLKSDAAALPRPGHQEPERREDGRANKRLNVERTDEHITRLNVERTVGPIARLNIERTDPSIMRLNVERTDARREDGRAHRKAERREEGRTCLLGLFAAWCPA